MTDHRGRLRLVSLDGIARQGYDLQLTRYDERGWRAIFCTTGMEHSPAERHRHGLGAHPLARDAAGDVGEALNQQRVE